MYRNMALAFAFVFAFSAEIVAQTNWPMINGNRERNSWMPNETILHPPFAPARDIAATGGQLAYADGVLYATSISDRPNTVYAIDAATGQLLWSFTVPDGIGGMNFTPAITDSLVLVGGQQGKGLYAVGRSDGTVRWSKLIGNLYGRSAILDAGNAYVIADTFYCLRTADGSVAWSKPFNAQGSPVADDLYVYIWNNGQLYAFAKNEGTIRWQVPSSGHEALCADGQFVYTNDNHSIVVHRKSDGAPVRAYQFPPGDITFATNALTVSDSHLAVVMWPESVTRKARLHVFEKAGGTIRSFDFNAEGAFPATIANGIAYVVTWKPGWLYAFDLATGALVFADSSDEFTEQPIVANHTLFVPAASHIRAFTSAATPSESIPSTSIGARCQLTNVYPQPARHDVTVHYVVGTAGRVRIECVDVLGRILDVLVDNWHAPGSFMTHMRVSGLRPGVVFLRIADADGGTGKAVVLEGQ